MQETYGRRADYTCEEWAGVMIALHDGARALREKAKLFGPEWSDVLRRSADVLDRLDKDLYYAHGPARK